MITPKSELNSIYKFVTRWFFSTKHKDIGTFFLEKLKLIRMNIVSKCVVVIFWFLRWQICLTGILFLLFFILRISYFWDLWLHSSIEYTPLFRFGVSKCYCDALPGRWGNDTGDEYVPIDAVEDVVDVVEREVDPVPNESLTMAHHLDYSVNTWRQIAINLDNSLGLYDSRRPQLNWITDNVRPVLVETSPDNFDYPHIGHDIESEHVLIEVEGRTEPSVVDLGNLKAWHYELNHGVAFSNEQLADQYRQDMKMELERLVDAGDLFTALVNQPPAEDVPGPSLSELRRSHFRDNP